MWIGGNWVEAESGKTYPVYNPATELEVAQVPLGGKADVDKAVAAARKALPKWSTKSQAERSQLVLKLATLLRESAKEIGELDTLEHGTPAKRAVFLSDANRFGQGHYAIRMLKLGLYKCNLWRAARFIQTKGKMYTISEGDGLAFEAQLDGVFGDLPGAQAWLDEHLRREPKP